MRGLVAIWVCLGLVAVCQGRTITVDDDGPADFNNIQAAIDDANEGDTIVVAEGIYYENIKFDGKDIVLRSSQPTHPAVVEATVIDGGFVDSVVMFSGTESPGCVLSGFTITNGRGHGWMNDFDSRGGGIYGNATSATIEYNTISGNEAFPSTGPGGGLGGGIYDCDGTIRYNTITENEADGDMAEIAGGGLYGCDGIICNNLVYANRVSRGGHGGGGLSNCGGTVRQNLIAHNYAPGGGGLFDCNGSIKGNVIYKNSADVGGGMCNWRGSPSVTNCTFSSNLARVNGGAIKSYDGSPMVSNCILWADSPEEVHVSGGRTTVTYSGVQGGWPGGGNIHVDPCFADPDANDYHLKSQAGRWEPATQAWVFDEVTSLCIDAGDPMSPVGLEPFPNGGIINMGAYGGTVEASKSYFDAAPCETIAAGDVNGDCKVNFLDFGIMAMHWLEEH